MGFLLMKRLYILGELILLTPFVIYYLIKLKFVTGEILKESLKK